VPALDGAHVTWPLPRIAPGRDWIFPPETGTLPLLPGLGAGLSRLLQKVAASSVGSARTVGPGSELAAAGSPTSGEERGAVAPAPSSSLAMLVTTRPVFLAQAPLALARGEPEEASEQQGDRKRAKTQQR